MWVVSKSHPCQRMRVKTTETGTDRVGRGDTPPLHDVRDPVQDEEIPWAVKSRETITLLFGGTRHRAQTQTGNDGVEVIVTVLELNESWKTPTVLPWFDGVMVLSRNSRDVKTERVGGARCDIHTKESSRLLPGPSHTRVC